MGEVLHFDQKLFGIELELLLSLKVEAKGSNVLENRTRPRRKMREERIYIAPID